MTELELVGPRAWGSPCGTAFLKASASDFQVNELLDIELSGQGEHLWVHVEKSHLNTEEAARRLAKAAKIPLKHVGYAGLKDRLAITRQWFSLYVPGREVDITSAASEQLVILSSQRHTRKLQRGAHRANQFKIRLTQLKADRSLLEVRLQCIQAQGVPNYFGLQRFGIEGTNVLQAQHYADMQELPQRRNLRSRLLSTARSLIFNQILAARVADKSWNQAQKGDVLIFTGSRSHFLAEEQDLCDPRLAAMDLHPSGALVGAGELAGAGSVRELEEQVCLEHQTLCNWIVQADLRQERRMLRLPVTDLQWCYPDDDTLELQFALPVGCYATSVVRELVELLVVDEVDVACEF